jgi:hypothetical protein
MSDQALISYAYNLGAEVGHSTQGEAECVCSEKEFTRIVLEKLADEGCAFRKPHPLDSQ